MSKNPQIDASLELEREVGDDSAAYALPEDELLELLEEDECYECGEPLDAFGDCSNDLCEN